MINIKIDDSGCQKSAIRMQEMNPALKLQIENHDCTCYAITLNHTHTHMYQV